MVPGFPGDEAGAQRSLASLAYSDHDSVARQCGGEIIQELRLGNERTSRSKYMITYFKLKKWREHGPGTISIEYEYVQKSENESDTCTSTKYKCSWPMAHAMV